LYSFVNAPVRVLAAGIARPFGFVLPGARSAGKAGPGLEPDAACSASNRTLVGILVHAVTLMSTHEHLVITDPKRCYPDFLRDLHRLVSLGAKVLRKWEGPVWDHEKSSVVRLLTEQAMVEKLAYVMANPVKAGLVAQARDWPGVTVLPHELGRRTMVIERPWVFFRADNAKWPDTVELTLALPPLLAEAYLAEEVRQAVADELERRRQGLALRRSPRGDGRLPRPLGSSRMQSTGTRTTAFARRRRAHEIDR
jgi:hypothetical protein